jgi:hypothetical protein
MSKKAEQDAQPEALATFAAAACNNGIKPGDSATEERDAADILRGAATGDKKRVDAAIAHHAKTDRARGIGARACRRAWPYSAA